MFQVSQSVFTHIISPNSFKNFVIFLVYEETEARSGLVIPPPPETKITYWESGRAGRMLYSNT